MKQKDILKAHESLLLYHLKEAEKIVEKMNRVLKRKEVKGKEKDAFRHAFRMYMKLKGVAKELKKR